MTISRIFPTLFILVAISIHAQLSAESAPTKTDASTLAQFLNTDNQQPELTEVEKLSVQATDAIQQKNWKAASGFLKAAFALDPNAPEVYQGFAKFHLARKEYASCENAIIKGLEIAPAHAGLLYEQSRISVIKNDLPSAISQVKLATQSPDSEWIHHNWYSHLLTINGEKDAAKSALKQAIQILEKDIKTVNQAINNYEQQERILSSYTAIEEVPEGSIGGGYKQIEVQKHNTERMVAPEAWKTKLSTMKQKKIELKAKLKNL